MRIMPVKYYFYFLIIYSFFPTDCLAQFSLKFNLESGIYGTLNEPPENQIKIESRMDGKLKYNYHDDNRVASIELRARPEIFGINNGLTSLKLKSAGSYYQYEKSFNWGINFSGQSHNFHSSEISSKYKMLDISGDISKILDSLNSILLKFGYSNRIKNTSASLDIELIFADVMWLQNFGPGLNFGYGIYIEKFSSNYDAGFIFNNYLKQNNGLRYGPAIMVDFLGSFILRGNYYLLIHDSDITKSTSLEHQVNLAFGKKIANKLSLILLIDYYQNQFRFKNNFNTEKHLYFPSNLENQISAKIAYDIGSVTELYAKSGYFNIDLQENESSFSGWNSVLGIQFSY